VSCNALRVRLHLPRERHDTARKLASLRRKVNTAGAGSIGTAIEGEFRKGCYETVDEFEIWGRCLVGLPQCGDEARRRGSGFWHLTQRGLGFGECRSKAVFNLFRLVVFYVVVAFIFTNCCYIRRREDADLCLL